MKKIFAILYAFFAIYCGASYVFAENLAVRNYSVTVQNGETVWSIARKYSHGQEDVREVVNRIIAANELQGKYIYPGQVLKVPAAVRAEDAVLVVK